MGYELEVVRPGDCSVQDPACLPQTDFLSYNSTWRTAGQHEALYAKSAPGPRSFLNQLLVKTRFDVLADVCFPRLFPRLLFSEVRVSSSLCSL